jgi:hypothetical protein
MFISMGPHRDVCIECLPDLVRAQPKDKGEADARGKIRRRQIPIEIECVVSELLHHSFQRLFIDQPKARREFLAQGRPPATEPNDVCAAANFQVGSVGCGQDFCQTTAGGMPPGCRRSPNSERHNHTPMVIENAVTPANHRPSHMIFYGGGMTRAWPGRSRFASIVGLAD